MVSIGHKMLMKLSKMFKIGQRILYPCDLRMSQGKMSNFSRFRKIRSDYKIWSFLRDFPP